MKLLYGVQLFNDVELLYGVQLLSMALLNNKYKSTVRSKLSASQYLL